MRRDRSQMFLPALLVVLWGYVWQVGSPRPESDPRLTDSIAALVTQDVRLRQVAVGGNWPSLPADPAAIVESAALDGDSLLILRIVPVVSHHWPRYTILQRGNHLARAAGFSRPDLREAWDLLGHRVMTPARLVERSRRLAQLCSVWGGEVLMSGGSAPSQFDDVLLSLPQSVRMRVLPDTLLQLDGRRTIVRVTTLERSVGMSGQWVPVVWVLEVTGEGRLSEWSQYIATPPGPAAGE